LKAEEYYPDIIYLTERRQYTPKSRKIIVILSFIAIILGLLDIILMSGEKTILEKSIGFRISSFMGFYLVMMGVSLLFNSGVVFPKAKAWVKIEKELIILKLALLSKKRNLFCGDLEYINILPVSIIFNLKNNQKIKIDLGWAPYNNVILLKQNIQRFASENSIPVK
jgi:hypothetical protein